jgi:4-amino-4-deoxy-L-arabinose transferase-like glycosyltransferase
VLLAIFLLALAPRAIVASQFDHPPATTNDAGWYDLFGREIAGGHGYVLPGGAATSRWPPGYPLVLGAVYKATGNSRGAARLAQAVLGALTAVLAAELARRLLTQRAGAIAGCIVALTPSLILYSSVLMSEILFTFLIMGGFLLGTQARSSRWSAALAGVAFGAATLVRAQGLLLMPALFASWWAFGGLAREQRRQSGARAAIIVAAAALTLVPWTVRNAVQLDTFAPVATNLGINLWTGNNPDATGALVTAPVAEFDRDTASLADPEKEVRFDALARDAALRYLAHHPLTLIARAPAKIFETFRNDRSFIAWYEPPGHPHFAPDARAGLGQVSDLWYYALLLLAAAGSVLLVRARAPGAALPLAALGIWAAVSVVFFGDPRYHVPLLPLFALPAAWAAGRAYDAAFSAA